MSRQPRRDYTTARTFAQHAAAVEAAVAMRLAHTLAGLHDYKVRVRWTGGFYSLQVGVPRQPLTTTTGRHQAAASR